MKNCKETQNTQLKYSDGYNQPFMNLSMIDIHGEIWKDVLGYETMYQVSNFGRIKSLLTNKIIKQWYCGNGQLMVTLSADGIRNKVYVSNIVGFTFIRNTLKGEVYTHLDSNKTNNALSNLSIENKKSQVLLSYHNGVLKDWGIKYAGIKTRFVSKQKYIGTDKKGIKTEYSYDDLLLKYGSGVRSIYRVLNNEKNFKTAYGQTWETSSI